MSKKLQNVISFLFRQNKKIVPLNDSKKPKKAAWHKEFVSESKILEYHLWNGYTKAFAFLLGKRDLIIDIDPRNGGTESYEKLKVELNLDFKETVRTGGGGYHIYTRLPNDTIYSSLSSILPGYEGIDFLKFKKYLIIPYSVINGKQYELLDSDYMREDFWEDKMQPTPQGLLELLHTKIKNQYKNYGTIFIEATSKEIEKALFLLDPDENYHQWLSLGMALHSYDAKNMKKLWIQWSEQSQTKFSLEVCENKWASFDDRKGDRSITIRTLFYFLNMHGHKNAIKKIFINRVGGANNNHEYTLSDIKKVANKYIYITTMKKVVHVTNRNVFLDQIAFNYQYDNLLPFIRDKNGIKKKLIKDGAFKYCLDDELFNAIIYDAEYRPDLNKKIFDDNYGNKIYNLYDPSFLNKIKKSNQYDDDECVKRWLFHLQCIIGDKYLPVILDWLSWQMQCPGKLVGWAPVIQGQQGIGKQYISKLISCIMFSHNVKIVNSGVLKSNFNSFAAGSLVNILEEFYVFSSPGKTRYENYNELKSLITDRHIQIEEKYSNPKKVTNVTNYIAFTNAYDAVPILKNNERRWFLIFSPLKKGDLPYKHYEMLEEDLSKDANIEKLRIFFKSREISEDFKKQKDAPASEYLGLVSKAESSKIEGLDEAAALIKNANNEEKLFYNNQYIVTIVFWKKLKLELLNILGREDKIFSNLKRRSRVLELLCFFRSDLEETIEYKKVKLATSIYMGYENIKNNIEFYKEKSKEIREKLPAYIEYLDHEYYNKRIGMTPEYSNFFNKNQQKYNDKSGIGDNTSNSIKHNDNGITHNITRVELKKKAGDKENPFFITPKENDFPYSQAPLEDID